MDLGTPAKMLDKPRKLLCYMNRVRTKKAVELVACPAGTRRIPFGTNS